MKAIAAQRSSSDKMKVQDLAERVENALRSPYGALPEDVLHEWTDVRIYMMQCDRAFYSHGERAMLQEVYERWADKERLANEFEGLRLYEDRFLALKAVSLEDAMRRFE